MRDLFSRLYSNDFLLIFIFYAFKVACMVVSTAMEAFDCLAITILAIILHFPALGTSFVILAPVLTVSVFQASLADQLSFLIFIDSRSHIFIGNIHILRQFLSECQK